MCRACGWVVSRERCSAPSAGCCPRKQLSASWHACTIRHCPCTSQDASSLHAMAAWDALHWPHSQGSCMLKHRTSPFVFIPSCSPSIHSTNTVLRLLDRLRSKGCLSHVLNQPVGLVHEQRKRTPRSVPVLLLEAQHYWPCVVSLSSWGQCPSGLMAALPLHCAAR